MNEIIYCDYVIIVIIYIIQNYIRIYIKKYTLDNTCACI